MRGFQAVPVAAVLLWTSIAASAQVSKPTVIWSASPNYTSSTRESSYDIDAVVIHTTEGTYSGAVSWFKSSASGVSAHYVISSTGEITQMVADDDIAWHATYYNKRSIGIECAGYAGKASTWTPALLDSLEKLVAWLCVAYDVPVVHPSGNAYDEPDDTYRKAGVLAHSQVQPWNKSDPGAYFPWVSFMADVAALIAPGTPPPAPLGLSPDGDAPATSPVTLSWSPMEEFAVDTFHVQVERWTGWSWVLHAESYPAAASTTTMIATAGYYRFAVWAHNAAGWGPGSAYAEFYGMPAPALPAAPTALSPSGGISKWGPSVAFKWGAVAGADKYEMYLQYYSGGSYKYYYAWTTTTNSKTVWPSATYTYYRWWVRAHNSTGWGPWSGGGSPTTGTGAAKFYFNK